MVNALRRPATVVAGEPRLPASDQHYRVWVTPSWSSTNAYDSASSW